LKCTKKEARISNLPCPNIGRGSRKPGYLIYRVRILGEGHPAFIGLFPNEGNSIEDVKDFERYLQFYILEEKIKLLDKIINSEVTSKDIFVRRADLLKEFKKEQSKISEKGN
jgi:hypothetical protein